MPLVEKPKESKTLIILEKLHWWNARRKRILAASTSGNKTSPIAWMHMLCLVIAEFYSLAVIDKATQRME